MEASRKCLYSRTRPKGSIFVKCKFPASGETLKVDEQVFGDDAK